MNKSWPQGYDERGAWRGMGAAELADAGIEALGETFPGWRIWADLGTGWHACRRGGFIQDYHQGAPAFYVHADCAGHHVTLPGAVPYVPGVNAVVHQRAGRVEERRHRTHVEVRDHEAGPLVGRQRLQDPHHLVQVAAHPVHGLLLRQHAERDRLLTRALVHAGQPERVRRLGAAPRGLERREVALGGVDQVTDDVLDPPVFAGGWRLPRARPFGQLEHAVRLIADDAQDGVLALV